MEKNIRLGRGLSALLGEDDDENVFEFRSQTQSQSITIKSQTDIIEMDINNLIPSPFQPRRVFTTEGLADLVSSIKEKGVLQPLLVRQKPHSINYEIIAGERRFRASKMVGLNKIPVIIKDFNDKDALEVALIENLQREDLNPLEEAEAYKRLLKEFNYTHEELSKVIGKSRSYLSNMMRLLDLPSQIKEMVENSQLSIGHARALLNAENPIELADDIIKKGYSVRQTEKLASKKDDVKIEKLKKEKYQKDNDIIALEKELSSVLNTSVNINWQGKSGHITINYDNLDKLDIILKRLSEGGSI